MTAVSDVYMNCDALYFYENRAIIKTRVSRENVHNKKFYI